MGQKVNPHGLRVGVIKEWDSKWYAEKDFADNLVEDHEIRTFLKKRLYSAGISKIEIERASDRVKIIVYTAKPGVVIGKGGSEIEKVKAELAQFTDKKLIVDIKEIKRPDKDAQLVAENIAQQLENRISFTEHRGASRLPRPGRRHRHSHQRQRTYQNGTRNPAYPCHSQRIQRTRRAGGSRRNDTGTPAEIRRLRRRNNTLF